jgi:hypothetical protein
VHVAFFPEEEPGPGVRPEGQHNRSGMRKELAEQLEIVLIQIQTRPRVSTKPADNTSLRQTLKLPAERSPVRPGQCPGTTLDVLAGGEFDRFHRYNPAVVDLPDAPQEISSGLIRTIGGVSGQNGFELTDGIRSKMDRNRFSWYGPNEMLRGCHDYVLRRQNNCIGLAIALPAASY